MSKQEKVDKALQLIAMSMSLSASAMEFADHLHAAGDITDEQLAETKAKYDSVGKTWDDRVKAAKERLG